jgi:hypothetical protein
MIQKTAKKNERKKGVFSNGSPAVTLTLGAALLLAGSAFSRARASNSDWVSALVSATPSVTPSATPSVTPKPPVHPYVQRELTIRDVVPSTPVKDQGGVGFCWAYATCGQIEALRDGQSVDLSEEWVGFWALYEQLLELAPTYFEKEIRRVEVKKGRPLRNFLKKASAVKKNVLNHLGVQFFLHPTEGAPDMSVGTKIVKKYGVVPEEVFSYKIVGDPAATSVEQRIIQFINGTLRDPEKNSQFKKKDANGQVLRGDNGKVMPDERALLEALARVFTLENLDASGPGCKACDLIEAHDQGFSYWGQRYHPTEFLEALGFDPDQHETVVVTESGFDRAVRGVEGALKAGRSVPIGLILMQGFREAVKGPGLLTPETCGANSPCRSAGGHAVLIVGRTTDASGKTNGFLIKNSWGYIGLNKAGQSSKGIDSGYQILTLDYLRETYAPHASAGERASGFGWQIELPGEFARGAR